MRFFAVAAMCFVLVHPALAHAELPAILGVTIGAPLTRPECPKNPSGSYHLTSLQATCWIKDQYRADSVEVWLVDADLVGVDFMRGGKLYLGMQDGKVGQIAIPTTGVASQRDAMVALRAKFGAPSRSAVTRAQNAFGAVFSVQTAAWFRPEYTVTFDAADSDLEWGRIEITTKGYLAAHPAKPVRPHL
jgi:hypothetical protein